MTLMPSNPNQNSATIFLVRGCRGKTTGNVIRHHPVDLLWHAAIITSQPRFHVADFDVQLAGSENAGQHGVRVPLHQNPRPGAPP